MQSKLQLLQNWNMWSYWYRKNVYLAWKFETIHYFSKNPKDAVSTRVIAGFKSPIDILFKDDIKEWSNNIDFTLTVDSAEEGYEGNVGLVTKYVPELKFENMTRIYRLSLNNIQEQFLISNKSWLNGFKLVDENKIDHFNNPEIPFACAFYTQKRNEIFIIGWNT